VSATAAGPLVLVVDDEPPIRALQTRILTQHGFRVLEAPNGLEALAMLEQGQDVDLLIADLEMPNLPGEEMVRRVHATRRGLKVLYVSGVIDRLLDKRLLRDGEAFLEKPFTADGLVEAVSLLLTGSTRGVKG
jgi:two-component system, cell cycle sensor histidine kinase and response regulator CckA